MKLFVITSILFNILNAKDNKLETIIKNNKLKVCICQEYYGISYLDQRTQKLIGIDSDLAKELAQYLKVKLEYIPSSFPTFIKDININKCDIAMFAIANTKERRKKVRFTTPHLSSDIYAITTKTNKKIKEWKDIDKKGIVVAVAKGSYHEPVMKKKLKNATLLVVNSFHQREEELRAGRADVFMTDYPFGKMILEKTNWAKLIISPKTYYKISYAWALAYGNEEFYNKIEKFIKKIKKDNRLVDLAKKNELSPIIKMD